MDKLGIDIKLILVQVVNFGLLLFILKKVLYKPVLDIIAKRRQEIEDIGHQKESLEKAKKEIAEEKKKILSDVREEKKDLLLNARREMEIERKEIIERANLEARDILRGTKKQIERDALKKQNHHGAKKSK